MFSKRLPDPGWPLALRLTLWYAVVFAVSSMLAFGVLYLLFVSVVRERTDDDLEEDIEEYTTFMQQGGMDRVRDEINTETSGAGDEAGFQIWGPSGLLLTAGLSGPTAAPADEDEEPRLVTWAGDPHQARWIEGRLSVDHTIRVGQSLEDDDAFIARVRNGFLATLGVALLLGIPAGWFLARRALRPVGELTRIAAEISEGALDRRVPVRSETDELGHLARTFNTMLDRIQALIAAMREMTDNMAHDLRSPLGRIRASSEMVLANGESESNLATSTIEECDRLMDMIDTTLDIAEAESGAARLKLDDVDLSALVLDAAELFRSSAEDQGILLSVHVPDRCLVRGDRHRLQRILANLIDNAIKYTPEKGRIDVRLQNARNQVRLSVEDTGRGMPPEEVPRIFQRFYRGDRSRRGDGNGLGLSLALAFARAQGGDIQVQSDLGAGSTFTVILPSGR